MNKTSSSEMFKKAYKAKGYSLRDLEESLGKKFRIIGHYADGSYPIPVGIDEKIADLLFQDASKRMKFLELCARDRLIHDQGRNLQKKSKKVFNSVKKKFSVDIVPDFYFSVFRDRSGFPTSGKELKLLANINRIKNGQKIYQYSIDSGGRIFKFDTENVGRTNVTKQDLSDDGVDLVGLQVLLSKAIEADPLGYLISSDNQFTYLNSAQVHMVQQTLMWALDYVNGDFGKLKSALCIDEIPEKIKSDDGREAKLTLELKLSSALRGAMNYLNPSFYSRADLQKAYRKLFNSIKSIR